MLIKASEFIQEIPLEQVVYIGLPVVFNCYTSQVSNVLLQLVIVVSVLNLQEINFILQFRLHGNERVVKTVQVKNTHDDLVVVAYFFYHFALKLQTPALVVIDTLESCSIKVIHVQKRSLHHVNFGSNLLLLSLAFYQFQIQTLLLLFVVRAVIIKHHSCLSWRFEREF